MGRCIRAACHGIAAGEKVFAPAHTRDERTVKLLRFDLRVIIQKVSADNWGVGGTPVGRAALISLHDIRYVRIGTGDMDQAVKFRDPHARARSGRPRLGAAYLPFDDRDHTLVYLDAPVDQHTVGFELRTQGDLDAAAAELEAAEFAVKAGTAFGM